jgi:hypothetical protein
LGEAIDLLGCEYLGGCPTVGRRARNKVELHFDGRGLTVAIAPQGLFTPAAAHPVVALTWPEMSALSLTTARREQPAPTLRRVVRSMANVLTVRLDLPYRLAIRTPEWTMDLGVRVAPSDLAVKLNDLLANRDLAVPIVMAT